MIAQRLEHPDALVDPAGLARLFGPIAEFGHAPLRTAGYSGSTHERLELRLASGESRVLVLKRTRLERDFTAFRTGDRLGREALPISEPALAPVWEVLACPYVAYATAPGEVALLMRDLTEHLMPDERAPLADDAEDRLLTAIAGLHARFWNDPAIGLPGLARPERLVDMVGPGLAESQSDPPHPVLDRARAGWKAARPRLPARLYDQLREPPEAVADAWRDLPRTLLHGDAKVANFALLPEGRVAAFDWGLVAAGPATIEIGWYLAVNATRLTVPKETLLARYRRKLEAALGRPIAEAEWRRLERVAIVAGARTLLWSKALALETGGDRARAEWSWWVEALERS
jgi:aminoglycoside phosphotransferase (APT) family kinase protein